MNYQEIKPQQLDQNPFKLIGSDWMLLTAEKDGKINTMTAAWGGLGIMWGKSVAFVVVRPQRYTLEFMDAADKFSLTFFAESYRETLNYLGTVSGRDEDKIEKSKLTTVHDESVPYFSEAELVMICRKLYRQTMTESSVLDSSLLEFYAQKDYHVLFIAEIEKTWRKVK